MFSIKHPIAQVCIFASLLSPRGIAQSSDLAKTPVPDDCVQINRLAVAQVANGHSNEAEESLSKMLTQGSRRREDACAGFALTKLAAILLASGRVAESERLAERAVQVLEKNYPPDDPVFLRPLHTLCSARLAQGKIGPARNTFKRMERISAEGLDDRLVVHSIAASLFTFQGRSADAELEYLAALKVLGQSNWLQTVSAATMLQGLAFVHIRQRRFKNARQEIDRAMAIFNDAKATVAADQLNILCFRAFLHINLAEWDAAETDVLEAISIANRHPEMDPIGIAAILRLYARVLRKTHRASEARAVEARAMALEGHPAALVDVSELPADPARQE